MPKRLYNDLPHPQQSQVDQDRADMDKWLKRHRKKVCPPAFVDGCIPINTLFVKKPKRKGSSSDRHTS